MSPAVSPSLYQINTRVLLTKLSRDPGRIATLDDISDGHLDRWAERGFDWFWLLSVWQTGSAGRDISRSNPAWCTSGPGSAQRQKLSPDRRESRTLPSELSGEAKGSAFRCQPVRSRRNSKALRSPGQSPRHKLLYGPNTSSRLDASVHVGGM